MFTNKHNGVSYINTVTGGDTAISIKRTEYASYRTDGHMGSSRNCTRNVSRCVCNNLSSEQSVCYLPLRPHARFQLLSELSKLQRLTLFNENNMCEWHQLARCQQQKYLFLMKPISKQDEHNF